jgi:signal transduction histidine kinase
MNLKLSRPFPGDRDDAPGAILARGLLGLSIVRSFVELHGGRIDIASAPGTGTRVTCTFPVRSRARPGPIPSVIAHEP